VESKEWAVALRGHPGEWGAAIPGGSTGYPTGGPGAEILTSPCPNCGVTSAAGLAARWERSGASSPAGTVTVLARGEGARAAKGSKGCRGTWGFKRHE